jgi:stage II sporulation protein AA (anti-sigma F factor antagonist)
VTSHSSSAPRLHIDDVRFAADGSILISLAGELDGEETERLRAGVTDLVRQHAPAPIRIDATRLTFLDSSGIRALITCHRVAEQSGSRLSIPWAHPHVFQVLQITGLLSVFDVVEQTDSLPVLPSRHAARPTTATLDAHEKTSG